MIQAVPLTATISFSAPAAASSSLTAHSMFAPTILKAQKVTSGYSGGGGAAPAPEAVTAADLAPPTVQTYAATPQSNGMSTTTKALIGGGVALVAVVAILAMRKRR